MQRACFFTMLKPSEEPNFLGDKLISKVPSNLS